MSDILNQSISNSQSLISNFINNSDRSLASIFGDGSATEIATDLLSSLAAGNLTLPIEVVPASSINNAQGAFGNGTIYLSSEVIATGNVDAVTRVLLEETGHFIDSQINSTDAPGDEGAIFASFVLGEDLTSQELALLQAEDDSATTSINGEEIAIEQMRTIFVNASGTGGNGTSWNNAYDRLQDALDAAESGDEIWVADGTYLPTVGSNRSASFVIPDGVKLYGGFAGGETNRSDRNISSNVTILSGDIGTTDDTSDNVYHVVTLSDVSNDTVLDGFTISDGNADGRSDRSGGGILATNSSTVLSNLVLTNNIATTAGGGIYSSNSQHRLNNIDFIGNRVLSGFDSRGGGIASESSTDTLNNVTFRSNFAEDLGGGLYSSDSAVDITNAEFIANRTNESGGGIFNNRPVRFTLSDGVFINNSALDDGGAIFNGRRPSEDTVVNISRSIFKENVADDGGAIYNFRTSGVTTDSLFVDNYALFGGAIYNDDSSPRIYNNTITGNIAQFGSAVRSAGDSDNTPSLINNIIWDNLSIFNREQISDSGSITGITNNLVQGEVDGSGNINANPRFVNPDRFDYRLREGSPGLDAGTNDVINTNDDTADLDLAGNARIVDSRVDLGAYEGVQVAPTPTEPQASDGAGIIYVDRDADGENNGASWDNAYNSLQFALRNAPLGSQIWVANGTYLPSQDDREVSFQLRNTVSLYGGFAGNETSLSQRNINRNRTVLSGELGNASDISDNSIHVVNASNVTSSAVLDGFTIRAGNADDASFRNEGVGGGIYSDQSQATFRNLVLEDNNASAGGGLFISQSSFHLLENVDFVDNTTTGEGGGVYNRGSATFFGSSFEGNNAAGSGGAIYNTRANLYVEGSEFDSNRATNGGGVYFDDSAFSTSNRERIINSVFNNNSADNGGGIYNSDSQAEGINLTFSNNEAQNGAAVYSSGRDDDVTPEYTNSIFWGNNGTVESDQIFNNGENTIVRNSIVEGGFAGQNIRDTDPRFINQDNGDLRVRGDSVAVNGGLNDFVIEEQDFADNVRIFDGRVDIGAYEYSAPYIAINDVEVEVGTTNGEPTRDGEASFTIRVVDSSGISAPQDSAITVEYRTTSNSATFGEDFSSTSGSVTFEAGQTSQTVNVPVFSNSSSEGRETFFLDITDVTGDVLDFEGRGVATIESEGSGNGGSGDGGSGNGGSGDGGSGNGGSGNGGSGSGGSGGDGGSGNGGSGDGGNGELQTIELYRFRNTTFNTGTYTFVGAGERDAIQNNPDFNQTFALEGGGNAAFTASAEDGEDLIPFFRLNSLDTPGTFLFVSTAEYDAIFAEGSDQRDKWVQEGLDEDGNDIPEFYLLDGSADRGIEFNRFQNIQNGTFLYAGPDETAAIENDPNLSSLFTNQGVAFESIV